MFFVGLGVLFCFVFLPGCCGSYERNVKFGFHVLEDQLAEVVSLLWSTAVEMYLPAFPQILKIILME